MLHYRSEKGFIEAEASFYEKGSGKLVKRVSISMSEGIRCIEVKGVRFSSCFKEEESDVVFDGLEGVVEKVGSKLIIR